MGGVLLETMLVGFFPPLGLASACAESLQERRHVMATLRTSTTPSLGINLAMSKETERLVYPEFSDCRD